MDHQLPRISGYVPHCPRCDYELAALAGVPAEPEGEFTADVACPECGFALPAGGRVIEGASNKQALWQGKGWDIFGGIGNMLLVGVWLLELLGWPVLSFRRSAAFCVVFMFVHGGVGFICLHRVWRRMQQGKLTSRAGRPGRGIRWVVSAAGIECVDRRNFLRPPKRTLIPAARVHRIIGASVAKGVLGGAGSDGPGRVFVLMAWVLRLDARGWAVDIEPMSIYALRDAVDPDRAGANPVVLASRLERSVGLPAAHGRGIPHLPLADRASRLRFLAILGSVCFGISSVAFFVAFQAKVLNSIATAGNPGGSPAEAWILTLSPIEALILTQGSALAAVALIYLGTLAVIRRARRRWVRQHVGAARVWE